MDEGMRRESPEGTPTPRRKVLGAGIYITASESEKNRLRAGAGGVLVLEREKLLGPECLIVDLSGGLNQVLQMSPREEIAEVDKLAVVLVLDVDDAPSVLAPAHRLAVDNHVSLGAYDSERNDVSDAFVQQRLLLIVLIRVERVQADVMVQQLGTDSVLEIEALVQSEGVGLGNDGNDIDNFGQFFHDDDIDWAEGVTGGVYEEEAAVDSRILDVAVSLRG